MGKVKVNREVLEAFDSMKEHETFSSYSFKQTVEIKIVELFENELKVLNDLDLSVFINALIFGYELDKKEELKERIKKFKFSGDRFCEAYVDGIYDVLDVYGIKIEGINK